MMCGGLTRRWMLAGVAGLMSAAGVAAVAGVAGEVRADPPPAVQSQEHQQNVNFARSLSAAFQSVAKKLEPSVVHITAMRRVPIMERIGFFSQPTGRTELKPVSLGSGAIVSRDGYIVTNNHVVANAEQVNVRLSDGREVTGARVVGRDALTDVAILKLEGQDGLVPAEFADSDTLEVGEWVVAIGSPFGFDKTVTAGIISAKGRSGIGLPGQEENSTYQDFIQTDAAINPGNSGGPLLNLEGRIIGVNSAIASRAGGSEGIGFAIPSNMVRAVMDSIIANGRVVRSWLGVNLADLGAADRQSRGLTPGEGVMVEQVVPEGPADKAGLKPGDVIMKFQGRPMARLPQLRAAIALAPPGTKAQLDVVRDGKARAVTVELGDQSQGLAAANGATYLPDAGLTIRTLTTAQAKRLGYRGVEGVLVVAVESGGLAENAELQSGDIIVALNDGPVPDVETFTQRLQSTDLSAGAELAVIRGNLRGKLTLQR
ncbi:MAG: Do family serine endopeptidase [Phycisphaerales bacterium]|nr:Do family serine endopeptidase [Phycisphaerales bacterium]